MTKAARMTSDTITALLLAAALALGGILMARQITESDIYQQSRIIRSIFSEGGDGPGITSVFTDARSRNTLFLFARGVANAYVSFELIPVNEAATFTAVLESMGPVVEIEEFTYHRKNLTITGFSPDENAYREFLRRLRSKEHFESVTGHYYLSNDDLIRFEITCMPAE